MPRNNYSDEPRIIKPAVTDRRFLAFILTLALIVIGVVCVVANIAYNNWQEEQSHLAERGRYEGAVYTIPIDGQPARIELGWYGDQLMPVIEAPGLEDAVLYVQGKFDEEALRPNPQYKSIAVFGPTAAQMNPLKHHKLTLRLEREGKVLWSDTLRAWGIHLHHHHH